MIPTTKKITNMVKELRAITGKSVTIDTSITYYHFDDPSGKVRVNYVLLVGYEKTSYSRMFYTWEELVETAEELKTKYKGTK